MKRMDSNNLLIKKNNSNLCLKIWKKHQKYLQVDAIASDPNASRTIASALPKVNILQFR